MHGVPESLRKAIIYLFLNRYIFLFFFFLIVKIENAYQILSTVHSLTLVWRLFIFHWHSTRVITSLGSDDVLCSSVMAVKSTETIRLIRDGEKVWRWGEDGVNTYRYTVTTRMTAALRWAAMRAVLMFH